MRNIAVNRNNPVRKKISICQIPGFGRVYLVPSLVAVGLSALISVSTCRTYRSHDLTSLKQGQVRHHGVVVTIEQVEPVAQDLKAVDDDVR